MASEQRQPKQPKDLKQAQSLGPDRVKVEVQDDTQAYDEAIMAQQERIQQEIAFSTPLVSNKVNISFLNKEYTDDDNVYQRKIQDLGSKYGHVRTTRRDGNCFYRAFGYSQLEALMDNPKELQRFKAVAAKSKNDLVALGFPEFTIEDFHSTFMDLIEMVERQISEAELLAAFNEQNTSDYVVVYLRLLTSGYLQKESAFFEHFVEGGRTVKEFCSQYLVMGTSFTDTNDARKLTSVFGMGMELEPDHLKTLYHHNPCQEVEPMAKESDHIHIIALAQALNISIRVEYMDRGDCGGVNQHDFPEGSSPGVFLLYRPGHYDILYKL